MLGLNKWFVIFLVFSLTIGYGMKNWIVAGQLILAFIVGRVVWKFLVK